MTSYLMTTYLRLDSASKTDGASTTSSCNNCFKEENMSEEFFFFPRCDGCFRKRVSSEFEGYVINKPKTNAQSAKMKTGHHKALGER